MMADSKKVLEYVPINWNLVELGTVLKKITGGGTPSKDTPEYWNGNIPWATVKDLKKTILNETIDYISEKGLKNSSANLVPAWTLITSTRMALGKAVFFTKDVSINQDLKALYPKESLDKYYLFHWFGCNAEYILGLGSGSTVKGIRLEVLKGMKISLPPLPEQKKIAEILSAVDDKIEVIDQQIIETQELKKGLMQRLLTKGIGHTEFKDSPLGMIPESWDIKILKEECIKINVGFVGTCEKFYCEKNEGVLMIRTGNLSDGKIKYSNLKYVTQEFHNKNTKSKIFEGDLLIARHGSSGQAVLVPKNFEESNCLNIIIIRPKTTLNPEFLKFQFNSNIIKEQVRKKTAGSTQGVVNTKEIARLIILHPPLPEQNKIANILNSIDDKLEVLLEKKTHYQELKQGLMQQLLTGKIRVKV